MVSLRTLVEPTFDSRSPVEAPEVEIIVNPDDNALWINTKERDIELPLDLVRHVANYGKE